MEVLKSIIHSEILSVILVFILLCFISLSFYGLWLCCGSRSTILNAMDGEQSITRKGLHWKNMFINRFSFKEPVPYLDDHLEGYGRNDQCIEGCSFLSHMSKRYSNWKNCDKLYGKGMKKTPGHASVNREISSISHLRNQALKLQWTSQWLHKQNTIYNSSLISESIEDLEECSLDCIISKLDSLILTFHSSDVSLSIPSETESTGTNIEDNILAISALNISFMNTLETKITENRNENDHISNLLDESCICMQGVEPSNE